MKALFFFLLLSVSASAAYLEVTTRHQSDQVRYFYSLRRNGSVVTDFVVRAGESKTIAFTVRDWDSWTLLTWARNDTLGTQTTPAVFTLSGDNTTRYSSSPLTIASPSLTIGDSGGVAYLGDYVAVDEETDAQDYFDVFRLGFFTGLAWELLGFIITIVRRIRGGTGME